MLSDKEIVCPNNLLDVAHQKKGISAGIVNAGKSITMMSVMDAVNENLIELDLEDISIIAHALELGEPIPVERLPSDIFKYSLSHITKLHYCFDSKEVTNLMNPILYIDIICSM